MIYNYIERVKNLKKVISLILCLSMLFTNICYAGNRSASSKNINDGIISETTFENGYNKAYTIGDNFINEGAIGNIKYKINIPKDMYKNYRDYSMTQYDDSGRPEYTVTFDDDKYIVQYNHKTGETTYPEKDGTVIYYVPGEERKDLKFPEVDVTANNESLHFNDLETISSVVKASPTAIMTPMAIGSPYYSDYVYSYEISPVGSQLVYRSVAKDTSWTQIGNFVVIDTWYFSAGATAATVISVFISALGIFAGIYWNNIDVMNNLLAAASVVFSGGVFLYGAYIQARANQYQENQQVTIRYNNSSGSIYEVATAYTYYRDVYISDTAATSWTQIENDIQYGSLLSGYDVCQSVHAGGDAQ